MNFNELMESAQAIALESKLRPDELATWNLTCREFSKRFHTPLLEVHKLDPMFVMTELYSDQLADWDSEERIDDLTDLLGSLTDPEYDVKKERTFREEMRRIMEDEEERVKSGRAVHESLEPKSFGEKPKDEAPNKLPASGGINMDLIKQLQNEESEGGF